MALSVPNPRELQRLGDTGKQVATRMRSQGFTQIQEGGVEEMFSGVRVFKAETFDWVVIAQDEQPEVTRAIFQSMPLANKQELVRIHQAGYRFSNFYIAAEAPKEVAASIQRSGRILPEHIVHSAPGRKAEQLQERMIQGAIAAYPHLKQGAITVAPYLLAAAWITAKVVVVSGVALATVSAGFLRNLDPAIWGVLSMDGTPRKGQPGYFLKLTEY